MVLVALSLGHFELESVFKIQIKLQVVFFRLSPVSICLEGHLGLQNCLDSGGSDQVGYLLQTRFLQLLGLMQELPIYHSENNFIHLLVHVS